MIGQVIDVAASAIVTALTMTAPGLAALAALRANRLFPGPLLPAAAVSATVLVAAPCLLVAMALQQSIVLFALLLALVTIAFAVVGVVRARRGPRASDEPAHAHGRLRWPTVLGYGLPAAILAAIAAIDAPHVRSDTYWHVALARKLADFGELSSSALAFNAGTAGNSSYPLPVWHALIALADHAPRVDLWFASWFLTLWAAPVAMFAFGAMAAELVGQRRATLPGAWAFLAIVVLGYGPWFYASRFLSYPGQLAIFVVLPIVVWAFVRLLDADRSERRRLLAVLLGGVVAIGALHANYELFPSLFALGGATLLLVGGHPAARRAFAYAGMVVATGAVTLAVQVPWMLHDANFLRGDSPYDGSPSSLVRHGDVLTGSEEWFWLKLGSLAAQPWLVVGALAIPAVLLVGRRRLGPWVLAGGAFAMVVTARVPYLVDLIDRAGSITPVTRMDRVYPAAVGVLAVALLVGWLIQRVPAGRARGALFVAILVACAAGSGWVDSLRDTRRIVVTPYVEARWVGGLDIDRIPLVAVWAASLLILAVAILIRVRLRGGTAGGRSDAPVSVATAFVIAIVVGLAPATIDRVSNVYEAQAYDRSARNDRDFERIEVYPPPVRREVFRFEPGSIVFADLVNNRRIASLVPVFVVGESIFRRLEDEPVETVADAAEMLEEAQPELEPADYLVVSRDDESMEPFVKAAEQCDWTDRSAGGVRIFARGDARC